MQTIDPRAAPTRLTQLHKDDCSRTTLAMVLGLSSAADFPAFKENQYEQEDRWLRERGMHLVQIPLPGSWRDRIEGCLERWLRGCPAILHGRTSEGHEHVVAIIDNKIVDTVDYTTGNPLVEPSEDGLYWLTIVVPVRRTQERP